MYCSEACRKRAKRAIAKIHETATGTTAATKSGQARSYSVETASPAGQRGEGNGSEAKADTPGGRTRDGRFERRDRHQGVSRGKTFKGCGRKLIAGAAALTGGPDGGGWAGVATCGMVHMCAWCAARILAVRAEYAQGGTEAHVAAGGGIVFTTHTLRHYRRMRYGTLRKGERGGLVATLHDAWTTSYGHRTGKQWLAVKERAGVLGYLRVFEDTWGDDTGHHLHFHVAWFTKRPLSAAEIEVFGDELRARWARSVEAAGGYRVSTSCDRPGCACGGKGHGVVVDQVDLSTAGAVGKYLFKDGDHAGVADLDGIGAELAFGNVKSGWRAGRLGPFELGDLAATGEAEAVEAWQEREYGVYGVRKMFITAGLRKHLATLGVTEDRTDAEIAADEGRGRVPIALFPRDTWYQHILPVRGRRLDLIHAAETGDAWRVRGLVESWGLVWGRDVLDPPPPVEGTADNAQMED
jgi:hypothetical protein